MTLLEEADPRLHDALRTELRDRATERFDGVPRGQTVVLAGHRAAGKSHLLPLVAQLLGRRAIDLDAEISRRSGRELKSWLRDDVASFRAAERETFTQLPPGVVVSVGGGFLALHPELLRGTLTVLVPISFETYVDRLVADSGRPRLMPELALLDELREVFFEREQRHRSFRPATLVELQRRLELPQRARRVVTLPAGANAVDFAWQARRAGADLLEVRTDLSPLQLELRPVARALPLLISQRGAAAPPAWLALATLVDAPLGGEKTSVVSLHAPEPLTVAQAVEAWSRVEPGSFIKHVEPLGSLREGERLLEVQAKLGERFGADRVTVLATGVGALPFRAVLAEKNSLDYLSFDSSWQAAVGQRLVRDARRAATAREPRGRLGILGGHLSHSRSPAIHPQPFDRIELPPDVDLEALLSVLRKHYRGFAITAPFKEVIAKVVGAKRRAVNTLARTSTGWFSANTDVAGAKRTLKRLASKRVTVLGAGGVLDALEEAAQLLEVTLDVRERESDFSRPVTGAAVWTWPVHLEPPEHLQFEASTVAVIAYGPGAWRLADTVRARGGTPVKLGATWFLAQAREQQLLWQGAT